jgi:DNA-binding protein YbaB
MFDKLKAVAGVASMLKDLPQMKAKLLETKEELGRLQCTGHSDCRRVRAVVNGQMRMVSISVESSVAEMAATEEGKCQMQEAILQATNDAMAHARKEATQRLSNAAQQMGLPLPPGILQHLQ